MSILRLTTATLSFTLLIACGGGGGGGGAGGGGVTPPPPDRMETLPASLITNIQRARDAISGSTPLSMTPQDIERTLESNARTAGRLLFSDIVNLSGGPDTDITCTGRICTGSISDGANTGSFDFSLDRFGEIPEVDDQDLIGFSQEYNAVMTDTGVTLVQGRAAGRTAVGETREFQSYSGWLSNSVFAVQIERAEADGTDTILLASYSFGDVNVPADNPSGPSAATWSGVVVGATSERQVVQGDVEVDIDDFDNPNVDVEFSNIRNLVTNAIIDGMTWPDLTLTDGVFEAADGSIEGVFYGTTHNEVGGVFDRHNITGAFGARRQ